MRSELSQYGQQRRPAVGMPVATFRKYCAVLGMLLAAILVLFADTFLSMARTWANSDTFLHGTLIFPISAWLIWLKREKLARTPVDGYWPGLLLLLGLSLTWWCANALGVQVVQQLAVVAMIVGSVITTMGPAFSRRIAFPLGYLIFAVPIGEALVPYLMDYTATFTVEALNLTGVPVFREGRYFSIPAGNFEIARACSGIRYLLAALALGTLFAYMMFHDNRKRMFFIAFSFVMPIVANGLRAYAIVLMAQYLGIETASGVDHVIFGWVFFGIIMLLMFYVGSLFADGVEKPARTTLGLPPADSAPLPASVVLLGAAVVSAAAGPALALNRYQQPPPERTTLSAMPVEIPGWRRAAPGDSEWRPRFLGADHEEFQRFLSGRAAVDVAIIRYRGHAQGGELANSENSFADPGSWRFGDTRSIAVEMRDGSEVTITEISARSRTEMRTIWYWYDVDGRRANTDLGVKLLEARRLMAGTTPLSSAVIMAAGPYGDVEQSRDVLEQFVRSSTRIVSDCLKSRRQVTSCGSR